MLIILMLFLMISSIMVLAVKRNRESLYIFGMCMSLAIMLSGILLYIAKKGGISKELQDFLFFNSMIKTKIQYYQITLEHLGFTIAIGRYLFPFFLLSLGLYYSMIPWLQRHFWVRRAVFLLPLLSLILYQPTVFRLLTTENEMLKRIITSGTNTWIFLYILLSVILLTIEANSIEMKFLQRKFILITTLILSLSLLYLLYCGQDPAQVYHLYSYENGIYYIKSALSIPTYVTLVIVNVIFAITGFTSLVKYTNELFVSSREEIKIQRKFEAISTGASVFVHGIKNQLLANRVIFKRLHHSIGDVEKMKEYMDALSKQNEQILMHIEELYRSVKTNVVHLLPIQMKEVVDSSIERFYHKYPDATVEIGEVIETTVLADKVHLSEAVYNLLINAQEAVMASAKAEVGKVALHCYQTRLYSVIEIKDNGIGINKKEERKILEPFYSSKNTNQNWGMGLHYVQAIAKEHFGNLRFESQENQGSTFYLLLPKYK